MSVSVAAVMRQVNNYFERTSGTLAAVADAPYVAVEGLGIFPSGEVPDGLRAPGADAQAHSLPAWGLYPPADFLALCEEIAAYEAAHPAGAPRSESFGAYRYEADGGGWEAAFAPRLSRYRRMFTEVNV